MRCQAIKSENMQLSSSSHASISSNTRDGRKTSPTELFLPGADAAVPSALADLVAARGISTPVGTVNPWLGSLLAAGLSQSLANPQHCGFGASLPLARASPFPGLDQNVVAQWQTAAALAGMTFPGYVSAMALLQKAQLCEAFKGALPTNVSLNLSPDAKPTNYCDAEIADNPETMDNLEPQDLSCKTKRAQKSPHQPFSKRAKMDDNPLLLRNSQNHHGYLEDVVSDRHIGLQPKQESNAAISYDRGTVARSPECVKAANQSIYTEKNEVINEAPLLQKSAFSVTKAFYPPMEPKTTVINGHGSAALPKRDLKFVPFNPYSSKSKDPATSKKHASTRRMSGELKCRLCDFTTFDTVMLERHVKCHQLNGRFSCRRCGFSQNSQHGLKDHLSYHHKISLKSVSCQTDFGDFSVPTIMHTDESTEIAFRYPSGAGYEPVEFTKHAAIFNAEALDRPELSHVDYETIDQGATATNRGGEQFIRPNCKDGFVQSELNGSRRQPTLDELAGVTAASLTSGKAAGASVGKYMPETAVIETPPEPSNLKVYESDPDIKQRTCSICGYQGKWISEMVRHKRVHTNERPFRCKYCSRTSKWKADLIRHVAKVHGVRVVSKYSRSRCFDLDSTTKELTSSGDRTVVESSLLRSTQLNHPEEMIEAFYATDTSPDRLVKAESQEWQPYIGIHSSENPATDRNVGTSEISGPVTCTADAGCMADFDETVYGLLQAKVRETGCDGWSEPAHSSDHNLSPLSPPTMRGSYYQAQSAPAVILSETTVSEDRESSPQEKPNPRPSSRKCCATPDSNTHSPSSTGSTGQQVLEKYAVMGSDCCGESVLCCKACPYESKDVHTFRAHTMKHENKKPYQCSSCGYRSNWGSDVHKHIRLKKKNHDSATVVRLAEDQHCDQDNANAIDILQNSLEHSLGITRQVDLRSLHLSCPAEPSQDQMESTSLELRCHRTPPCQKPQFECLVNNVDDPTYQRETLVHSSFAESEPGSPNSLTAIPANKVSTEAAYKCVFCDWKSDDRANVEKHMKLHCPDPSMYMPIVDHHAGLAREKNGDHNGLELLSAVATGQLCTRHSSKNSVEDAAAAELSSVSQTSSSGSTALAGTHSELRQHRSRGIMQGQGIGDIFSEFEAILQAAGVEHDECSRNSLSHQQDVFESQSKTHQELGNTPLCKPVAVYGSVLTDTDHEHYDSDEAIRGVDTDSDTELPTDLSIKSGTLSNDLNSLKPRSNEIQKVTTIVCGQTKKMWQCRYCAHMSRRRANVRLHERKHYKKALSSAGKLQCELCLYQGDRKSLLQHKKEIHSTSTQHSLLQCPATAITLSEKPLSGQLQPTIFAAAKVAASMNKPKKYSCSQCPAKFADRNQLARHGQFHDSEHKFRCHLCSYAVPFAINLTKHFRSHHRVNDSVSVELNSATGSFTHMRLMPGGNGLPHNNELNNSSYTSSTSRMDGTNNGSAYIGRAGNACDNPMATELLKATQPPQGLSVVDKLSPRPENGSDPHGNPTGGEIVEYENDMPESEPNSGEDNGYSSDESYSVDGVAVNVDAFSDISSADGDRADKMSPDGLKGIKPVHTQSDLHIPIIDSKPAAFLMEQVPRVDGESSPMDCSTAGQSCAGAQHTEL